MFSVLVLLLAVGAEPGSPPALELKAEARHAESSAHIRWEGETAIIEIRCTRGIGGATLVRGGDVWPKRIIVRVYLTGLEWFAITCGDKKLGWSVASTGDHATRITLQQDQKEQTLAADSPYYAEVRVVGERRIPLPRGYFEIHLPERLLAENPHCIQLEWVDFYRR